MTQPPDFIARLAARATGAAPAVRPRLPSRFEDARAGDPAVVEYQQLATAPPARPPQPPPRTTPQPPPRTTQAPVPSAPVVAARPEDSRPADEHQAIPASVVPVLAETAAGRPESVRSEHTPVGRTDGVVQARTGSEVMVRAVPAAVPVQSAASVVTRSDAATGDAAVEQFVRITIGRVEVRAAPAAAPPLRTPHRPAPVKDTLSLHDYLRGRRSSG